MGKNPNLLHPPCENKALRTQFSVQSPNPFFSKILIKILKFLLPSFPLSSFSLPPDLKSRMEVRPARRRQVGAWEWRWVGFLFSFLQFSILHLLWFINLDLWFWVDFPLIYLFYFFSKISWLIKVCSGLIWILRFKS